jgi:hypothetical protein
MERFAWRAGLGVVALIIGLGIAYYHRGSANDDFRKQAHKLIARVEGYSARPDYYDYLVDEAHDEVFNDAYHMEVSRRGGDRSWVDRGQYEHDLFAAMIRRAGDDHATGVVEALTKFRQAQGDPNPAQQRR